MNISYRLGFYLQKVYGNKIVDKSESQIRMSVRFNKNTVVFNVGYTVNPDKWDSLSSRVKKNTVNKKGYTTREINQEIQRLENLVDDVIKVFEVEEVMPTAQQFKKAFNLANGRDIGLAEDKHFLVDYFNRYIVDRSNRKGWTNATIIKHRSLKNILEEYSPLTEVNHVNTEWLYRYANYLLEERGMQNTSIKKHMSLFRSYLSWLNKNDHLKSREWESFSLELKTVRNKQVVFLTWDELIKLYELSFPDQKQHLERVRDVFCFQCFTSLRFSDVLNLRKSDVFEDHIKIVTEKTDTSLTIDLNSRSKAILSKYKYIEGDLALPVCSNQKTNQWIKECCFIAGLNEPVTHTYFKGSERVDVVKPKYEMVGTHTGRRTFICNALVMGISPEIVMKWTGHTSYKQMQPYIDVANEEKKKAMKLFDK